MEERTDKRTDIQTDGWMDGWMDGLPLRMQSDHVTKVQQYITHTHTNPLPVKQSTPGSNAQL